MILPGVAKTGQSQPNLTIRPLFNKIPQSNTSHFLARKLSLTTRAGRIKMAHDKLKKEMLASIDQYKNFIETEQERIDTYITALNTNESKIYSERSNNSLSTCFFTVPKKIQDAKEELERLLVSGKVSYLETTGCISLYRESKG